MESGPRTTSLNIAKAPEIPTLDPLGIHWAMPQYACSLDLLHLDLLPFEFIAAHYTFGLLCAAGAADSCLFCLPTYHNHNHSHNQNHIQNHWA